MKRKRKGNKLCIDCKEEVKLIEEYQLVVGCKWWQFLAKKKTKIIRTLCLKCFRVRTKPCYDFAKELGFSSYMAGKLVGRSEKYIRKLAKEICINGEADKTGN